MNDAPELLEVVRRWVQKAENDLITAEHTLELEERCPHDTVCFHAQQCVEKYLKALLTLQRVDFPKMHDVAELYAILPDDARPEVGLAELKELSPYAVEVRYPNDWLPITREKAVRAVEIARQVRSAVRALLPS